MGAVYSATALAQALKGERVEGVDPGFTNEVIYVITPVQRDGITVGALRLSYEVNDIRQQFGQVRNLILGGVALAAFLGLGLAIGLALTITRPLRQLSERIQEIASRIKAWPTPVPRADARVTTRPMLASANLIPAGNSRA